MRRSLTHAQQLYKTFQLAFCLQPQMNTFASFKKRSLLQSCILGLGGVDRSQTAARLQRPSWYEKAFQHLKRFGGKQETKDAVSVQLTDDRAGIKHQMPGVIGKEWPSRHTSHFGFPGVCFLLSCCCRLFITHLSGESRSLLAVLPPVFVL